jgi:hypothetical protein
VFELQSSYQLGQEAQVDWLDAVVKLDWEACKPQIFPALITVMRALLF